MVPRGAASTGNPRAGTAQFTGTLSNGSYVVTLSDPSAGDGEFTLSSVGTDQATGRTRTLLEVVRAEPVEALNYAMYGNKIEFHNHNKVPYGVSLNTSVYSNGNIQIDKAISIIGPTQAVNAIRPNTGPASNEGALPNTVLSPGGQQGDPNPSPVVAEAPVVQVVPAPKVEPFPSFDFYAAQQAGTAAGRTMTPTQLTTLIANAKACAGAMTADGVARAPGYGGAPAACAVNTVYNNTGVTAANVPLQIVHYLTGTGAVCPSNCPNPRSIAVPNGTNPNNFVPLGSANGTSNPAANTHLHEIRLAAVNAPLSDTLLYISGSLTLENVTTTLVQVQGSLIVNGSLTVHSPMEILAWYNRTGPKFVPLDQTLYDPIATTVAQAAVGQPYDIIYSNWPAIAANGGVKVDDSGGGNGGPVHIEGAVYTVAESHFHKSNGYESSYSVGSEIADTIHNCQWLSFAYDPQARKTFGLYNKAAGRVKLQVIRREDRF